VSIKIETEMEENYLESIRKQFEYYKMLGERTFDQLEEDELFRQFSHLSITLRTTTSRNGRLVPFIFCYIQVHYFFVPIYHDAYSPT